MPLGRAALDFYVLQGRRDKVVVLGSLTQPNSHDFSVWLTLVFSPHLGGWQHPYLRLGGNHRWRAGPALPCHV